MALIEFDALMPAGFDHERFAGVVNTLGYQVRAVDGWYYLRCQHRPYAQLHDYDLLLLAAKGVVHLSVRDAPWSGAGIDAGEEIARRVAAAMAARGMPIEFHEV